MISVEEWRLIRQISDRAAKLYLRLGSKVDPEYIGAEVSLVHEKIVKLRLKDLLDADDGNFAHDVAGIHNHLDMVKETLGGCFMPRYGQG